MPLRRFVLPAVPLVALFVVCGVAGAARSYLDPPGDVHGGGGPDITSVRLSSTASRITFRIRFARAPPLRVSTEEKWIDMLLIGIDVPPLGAPPVAPGGDWRGADFALGAHGASKAGQVVRLGRRSPRVATFEIRTVGSTLTFSVARRALGNPRWFAFVVAAGRETESAAGGGADLAPDRGTFRYAPAG